MPRRTSAGNAERVVLSERDSLKVLDLLENPPKPTARLRRAAIYVRAAEMASGGAEMAVVTKA